jgi:hypothetical protein
MTGLAIRAHSPWPLFSQDEALAKHWLLNRWQEPDVNPQLLHWGLHFGLHEELKAWLRLQGERISRAQQCKLWFRLARLEGRRDAALAFLEPVTLRNGAEHLQTVKSEAGGLRIRLNGGIGDHLQDLTLIHSWSAPKQTAVILETTAARQQQLQRLIDPVPWLNILSTTCPPSEHPLTSFGFTAFAFTSDASLHYSPWLSKCSDQETTNHRLVCCWRSEGSGDALSSFLRSVSLPEVLEFYTELRSRQPGLQIVDISGWKDWERPSLLKQGIELHNPAQGDVADLQQLLCNATVVSIDTALCHLCACMALPAWVLLPRYADERWLLLRQTQHCYGQVLQFLQQEQQGSWDQTLQRLLTELNR